MFFMLIFKSKIQHMSAALLCCSSVLCVPSLLVRAALKLFLSSVPSWLLSLLWGGVRELICRSCRCSDGEEIHCCPTHSYTQTGSVRGWCKCSHRAGSSFQESFRYSSNRSSTHSHTHRHAGGDG